MALNNGFRLGDWEVLPLEGRLQRDGETRRLRPRAMDVLCRLAARNLAEVERLLRGLADGHDPPDPVTRAELADRIAAGRVTVLDVRPEDEFARAHIPGAVNVQIDRLAELLPSLPREAEIVAYCRGPYCIYADQAVSLLRRHGFAARKLDGGLPEWRADGRTVSAADA